MNVCGAGDQEKDTRLIFKRGGSECENAEGNAKGQIWKREGSDLES